jgi:hypothetical protein
MDRGAMCDLVAGGTVYKAIRLWDVLEKSGHTVVVASEPGDSQPTA